MRTLFSVLILSFLTLSCSSVKRTQKYTAKGEYDKAIDLAVKKLQKSTTSKDADAHIAILEEAFAKATEEDLRQISTRRKEKSRVGIRAIYYTYLDLENRQNKIRPLLPLTNRKTGKTAKIKLTDYSSKRIQAQEAFVSSLYEEATEYMRRKTKQDYRNAHVRLTELEAIQSNYRDVHQLLEEAHFQGSDFVLVQLNNHSGQIIPVRLQQELLDFNTYGLDDFWTEYHSVRNRNINYSYGIDLNFQTIEISPERITQKEYLRKKRVKDGEETQRDRAGNIVRDSLGNPVKIARYVQAEAKVEITTQEKAVFVGGTVVYTNLENGRQFDSFPLSTEFIFENISAVYSGDKRALEEDDKVFITRKLLPFPSNEQMVFDAGEAIKSHLKTILRKNKLN